MNKPTILNIQNVSYSYGNRKALEGVSLEIVKGQIFGLLGPNGSGKTTLFRLLSTLMKIQSGKIQILGKTMPSHLTEIRSSIGIVFQHPSLDGKLTVEENLRHQGHLYGLRGADLKSRIEKRLRELKLTDRTKDRVETLSGGLKRRVEIAKSLLHEPEVLILDEPSTGLDPVARLDLWQTLKQLNQTHQTTLLLTTHFMEEAERCDCVAILDRGRLAALGSPQELKSKSGKALLQIEPAKQEDTDAFFETIKQRFGRSVSLVKEHIRIEDDSCEKLVAPLMSEFAKRIASVSVKRPTLEDVFIHLTGHEFHAGNDGN